ncbi:hypothetical protein GCM10027589_34320 [Actinocorallia lasiicapitis]
MARRPSLEERIAARQAGRGPMKEGKYFEHGPAKIIFAGLIVVVVLTHLIALLMIKYAPG